MEKITWNKKYHEDVGAEDASGNPGYAYYYHMYWFSLPDKQGVKVRRYTDNPDQCSVFFPLDDLERRNDSESLKMKEYLYAIIDFLVTKEGVKKVDFLNRGYKPVDLAKIKKQATKFAFEETKK